MAESESSLRAGDSSRVDGGSEAPAPSSSREGRWALLGFGAIEIAALPLLLVFGRNTWFTQDDWDFLSARTVGNAGDWFRAHYQHWCLLPMLIYRALWNLVGINHYLPYLAVVIVAHLAVVALLRVVLRRAGVRPWLATVLAGAFVFFGAGAENILVAFQITFVGAFAFGLLQVILADHDDGFDRRDWLALLAGFVALLFSGVAVTMTLVAGITVLLRRGRRGWRVALFHTVPIAVAYLAWTALAPKGQAADFLHSHSPVHVTKFALIGVEAAFGGLGQLPGVGIAVGVVLVAGFVLAFRAQGRSLLGGARSAPIALLAGAVFFLFATGVARSGQSPFLINLKIAGTGTERARESRYIYLIAAMCLPAIGLAADWLVRRSRVIAIAVIAVLFAGVPANVHQLATYSPRYATPSYTKLQILSFPRLPLAYQLRHSPVPFPVGRLIPEGLTLGWLVDSLPSGRLPDPGPLPPHLAAIETLHFMIIPGTPSSDIVCEALHGRVFITLPKGGAFTIEFGNARVMYLPAGGAPSGAQLFAAGTYTALAGPLRLRITPMGFGVQLCQ